MTEPISLSREFMGRPFSRMVAGWSCSSSKGRQVEEQRPFFNITSIEFRKKTGMTWQEQGFHKLFRMHINARENHSQLLMGSLRLFFAPFVSI